MADKECEIAWKTKMSLERWYCRATGSSMDKDSKGQRQLFPAVKGHSLEQNRTDYLIITSRSFFSIVCVTL